MMKCRMMYVECDETTHWLHLFKQKSVWFSNVANVPINHSVICTNEIGKYGNQVANLNPIQSDYLEPSL